MSEGIFERTNFSLAKNIQELGPREKETVKTALNGLCETQKSKKEQPPIKITISAEKPFEWKKYANVMHELGIDISSTGKKEETTDKTTVIFSPKPYGNNQFIKGLISSPDVTNHFIESFLNYEPSPVEEKR